MRRLASLAPQWFKWFLKPRILLSLVGCASLVKLLLPSLVRELLANLRKRLAIYMRDASSRWLHQHGEHYPCSAHLRVSFNEVVMPLAKKSAHHSHPGSAASRNYGATFVSRVASYMGMEPYYYQQSIADQRNSRSGSRSYYWSKDVSAAPLPFAPNPNDLLGLVDVDHYVDMPEFLATNFQPTVIYTFQPCAVARVTPEYSYTFNGNNELRYVLGGGSGFKHQIWNWSVDTIMVRRYGHSGLLMSPDRVALYNVDHRAVDDDHKLVMLTPVAMWTGWTATLADYILSGHQLKRLKPVHGRFLRLRVFDGSPEHPLKMSTGLVDGFASVSIPATQDEVLQSLVRTNKTEISLPQIRSHLTAPYQTDGNLPLLLEYLRSKTLEEPDLVIAAADSVRGYQFEPASYDPDCKIAAVGYMSPIVHGAFAAALNKAAEERCVKARILDVRSTVQVTKLTETVISEFLQLFIPKPGILHPTTHEEVAERQSRPGQRATLVEADQSGNAFDSMLKVFLKKETYPKVNDPRAITTLPGVTKLEYSRYIYAVSDEMKGAEWYAFGHSPNEVASRVSEICCAANTVVATDLSRFDGRVSPILRELERRVLLRYFPTEYHDQILTLHTSQFNVKAVTAKGVKYDLGTARASGSPETSAFNSIANAFMAYYALRRTQRDGAFMSPQEAYAGLGIYGGDDGLTGDVPPHVYTKACADVGQTLVAEEITRGKIGVKFLARYYSPEVWYGCIDSMADVGRQLSKFHTSVRVRPQVTPADILVEKATGFLYSDPNTPLLGPLCHKVAMLSAGRRHVPVPEVKRWNSGPEFGYTPNEDTGGWMSQVVEMTLPGFDHKKFHAYLHAATSLEDLLTFPVCLPVKPAVPLSVPVVVDGDVLPAALPPPAPPLLPPPEGSVLVNGVLRMAGVPDGKYDSEEKRSRPPTPTQRAPDRAPVSTPTTSSGNTTVHNPTTIKTKSQLAPAPETQWRVREVPGERKTPGPAPVIRQGRPRANKPPGVAPVKIAAANPAAPRARIHGAELRPPARERGGKG